MNAPNGADIIHAKALDAVSNLIARYEDGQISAETFRVGVEVVWTCCGGVCTKDEFEELMGEAEAYARSLPRTPHVTVMRGQKDSLIILEREGSTMRLTGAGGIKSTDKAFDLASDAVAYEKRTVEAHVKNGWVVT